jgi:putative ABC transport system permease protein
MKQLRAFLARLAGFLGRGRPDHELEEELQSHLALAIEDGRRAGLDPHEARRRALLELGGVEVVKEAYRDRRGLPALQSASLDLRYAARTLRRNASFTVVAVATLALGIGASTTMFSVAEAVLLRPLPYAEPDRLIEVTETNPLKKWTGVSASPANFADWRRSNTVFTDMAGYIPMDVFLTGQGEPQRLRAVACTANLLDVLGVRPLLGRTFTEEETFEGKHRVVILSHGLWQTQFAGDPGIVGRTVSLDARAYDVVGVMPPGFFFPRRDVQLFRPWGIKPSVLTETRRPHFLDVLARLRPGVSPSQADEEMRGIAAALERAYPDTNTQMGVRLEGFHATLSRGKRPALLMLLAAVGVLFLVVCSNVANLQLGRAATRAREFAIRHALGADRRRLARQVLAESAWLSVLGGAIGLALTLVARETLVRFAPQVIPGFAELRLNMSVLIFALGITFVTPLLFGLGPALAASRAGHLRERSEIRTPSSRFVRDAFVACEVALSVVLVVSAFLLVRSLIRLESVDPGFQPQRAISFSIALPSVRYPAGQDAVLVVGRLEERLKEEPAVQVVGGSVKLPLQGYAYTGDATVEGREGDDYERELRHNSMTPDYFRAVGTPLLRGRLFDEHDQAKNEQVTVVNEALERAYFRGQPAVGRRVKFGRPQDQDGFVTIVGVVANQQQDSLEKPALPEAFVPFTQEPNDALSLVVRGEGTTEALVGAARRAVASIDPELAVFDVRPLDDLVRASTGDQRFRTALLGGFASLALLLAILGVYGVLAYSVTQRTREIGIRMTLGAPKARLFGMVLYDGMRPVVAGAFLGLPLAFAAGISIRALLFGIGPTDPSSYTWTVVALGMVALGACVLPASRALRVDPMVCLRDE